MTGKEVILAIIAQIGAAGATGHVIEFAGSAIRGLSMEGRLTLCNMSIEAGGRAGMVAPDETTFEYLRGRLYAPKDAEWDQAVSRWRELPSDPGAVFDTEIMVDGNAIQPMVTWGNSPEDALPIGGSIPDPEARRTPSAAARWNACWPIWASPPARRWSTSPSTASSSASCTNSRIEDLRAAAAVAKGRKVADGVVAGSSRAANPSSARRKPKGCTPSSPLPASTGGSPAVPCASAPMVTSPSRGNASPPPRTATSWAARAPARGRIC